ncbi:DUF5316 domain-containing protein [Paenibacillus sp. TRM 82003]|nr:DUF5316 domain-containing protein [Paenibacillus sp. TRM 82003]
MKYKFALLWGCISAITLGLIVGAALGLNKLLNLYGYVSLGAVGVCIILSGSMLSGDRLRANYHTEDTEDRRKRNSFIGKLLLFSSPYALIAVTLYALK